MVPADFRFGGSQGSQTTELADESSLPIAREIRGVLRMSGRMSSSGSFWIPSVVDSKAFETHQSLWYVCTWSSPVPFSTLFLLPITLSCNYYNLLIEFKFLFPSLMLNFLFFAFSDVCTAVGHFRVSFTYSITTYTDYNLIAAIWFTHRKSSAFSFTSWGVYE